MTERESGTVNGVLKIGLVFDDSLDRPDGVQQYVLTLGAWFAQQGHEVHYLVGETSRTDLSHVHSLARNMSVRYNGNRLTVPLPASSRAIKQLLAEESFDVLHIMMPYSPMMAGKVIKWAPKRTTIVGTFHILPQNRLVRWSTSLLGVWLGKTLARFDSVFAVSSSAAQFAESSFGLREVKVLPNVVDVPRFSQAKPLAAYAQDDVLTIMFLGRLVPRKGCIDLLKALREVRKASELSMPEGEGSGKSGESGKRQPFRLVVCGKGPQAADLQQAAQEFGFADLVTFTGFVSEEEKPSYLAAADIAVFPSTGGESFGIVLIEAMATGGPVVLAASNPGYETVMEPSPQQMFRPGDFKGLARLLSEFMSDAKGRQTAVAWQDKYVRQFDTAVVGEQLVAEYKRLQK